ncbi:DUF3085 domain-containing protein [Micromonospora endolithica]|uniref:DUF3085 domain-containing protein n=1 Tax=Micromonospora endolithica TaxID=230091 RepID=A0A3A9ZFT8_9ACTN|nr:DUF3085 domain-containing protein [Micromonospora endolithica]RKN46166.1 DUF3085 domain-containing protein [Micromonospora endolithica]TWJ25127.1 Protein of unknown function (DUF3085) [Micromonospora endolithica]
MATHLYFDLTDTLRLAEHAVAAAEHAPTFTEREDGTPCPGALEWVHDHGVYLMSSGLPRLTDPSRPDANLIVYAHGWNPDTDGHPHAPDLGDDFVEHLHLTEVTPTPLIDTLRAAHAAGYRWLHLTVTADTYEVRVIRNRRHD